MKHLRSISTTTPARAAVWQDAVCNVANFFAAFLGAFGGSSPFLNFVAGKCEIPENND